MTHLLLGLIIWWHHPKTATKEPLRSHQVVVWRCHELIAANGSPVRVCP